MNYALRISNQQYNHLILIDCDPKVQQKYIKNILRTKMHFTNNKINTNMKHNQHQMIDFSFSWEQTVSALLELHHNKCPSQQTQTSINLTQDHCHQIHHYEEQIEIVSLFHSRFQKLYGEQLSSELTNAFALVDYDSPQNYNLGRNTASSIIFSQNHQFILKTISWSNFNHFKKVFNVDYFTLVEGQGTVIAKMYGMYSMEMFREVQPADKPKKRAHFILMENLFYSTYGGNILMVFDLKGAQINRHTQDFKAKLEIQQNSMNQKDIVIPTIIGKDNDFKQINDNPVSFLEKEIRSQVMDAIKQETLLMQQSNIMDYSLMLIVAKLPPSTQNYEKLRHLHIQDDMYLTIGIIDYLQDYNQSKVLESKFKSFLGMFNENKEISCVDSERYRQRFLDYCFSILA